MSREAFTYTKSSVPGPSRKWQLTPVFLPGKSHGQRSLACWSPWDHACTHTHTHTHTHCTQERMSNECKTPVISKPSSGEFVARGVDCSSLISMAIKGNPEGVKKAASFRKDDHPPGGVYVAGEWGYTTRDLPFS